MISGLNKNLAFKRIIWNNTTIYVRDSQLRDYFMKKNAEQLEKYHATISEVYNW